ncbi:isoaspartyl peptidase/L-asparaginase [Elysia marginata]|uniref:Isoaspartyl peptidase/L-asparaginase n=1 Tax=Elysia marginata TaxID=1093978 RepID=A0AAV4FSD1_9GAST|nr:isoaspartyl peptidase/L-asparaginase [Elysia marginata]
MTFESTIIVHGGARTVNTDDRDLFQDGVKAAARQGYTVLTRGGSAVDAVVAAVSAMEDDSTLNAGHGSRLTMRGEVEVDAIVIDGQTLDSGAVCALRGCANPVQLARLVMDKLATERTRAELQQHFEMSSSERSASIPQQVCDTVGAVAMDAYGNLAAATSTGGITAKLPGRVGDSPIIGSGAYADNTVGAVSTTGQGEFIMKVCLARRVGELLEKGWNCRNRN